MFKLMHSEKHIALRFFSLSVTVFTLAMTLPEFSANLSIAIGDPVQKVYAATVVPDTEPPVITGVRDQKILVGEGISYKKGVLAADVQDGFLEFSVDTGGADNNVPGVYTITYSAQDAAGNVTTETCTLTVVAEDYNEDTVNQMADAVLASILKEGMTQREKLTAIYNWTRTHIKYVHNSEKYSYVKGAYEGLHDRKGDCYVYFATAKALLNRAGIENKDIEKLPGYKTRHYWNLVNIGEGWYHFDTCPRKGGGNFNYISDDKLMAYSAKHGNSHIYDPTLYPAIVGQPIPETADADAAATSKTTAVDAPVTE